VKTTRRVQEQQSRSTRRRALRDDQHPDDRSTVIPVIQEELDVQTRRVERESGVRVSKTIEECEEVVDELLTREDVEVERVRMNVPVEAPGSVRYEGDTMIIPIFEEVVVVEKRLMLKEEIRVTRRKTSFHAPQRVALRREVPTVERIEDPGSRAPGESERIARESHADSLVDERRQEQEQLRTRMSVPRRRK
jgi:stress response protein YsnF